MPLETAPQTAGTTPDTGAPAASTDTLLTPAAPPAVDAAAPPAETPPATPPAPEAPAAPAEYADFTAPEGVTFNPEATAELKAFAKEKGLTQEEAQRIADIGSKTMQKMRAEYVEKIEQAQAQWLEAARTDKEFGGDALAQNVAVAKKALDAFGSPQLLEILNESGLGNHPEFIRAFYRVGKAISEDKVIAGATRPAGSGPSAQSMYDKSGMNP